MLVTALCSITLLIFGQSERYTAAMKKNLAAMDTSFRSPASLVAMANSFERIATAEKIQWLPYYYAAFSQVNAGFMEQDKAKIDAYADKAALLIQKADSLAPNNSEISCIKSMIASCHLMVDPMTRYMEYGKMSGDALDAAISQDPTNPRPHFLKGQGLKYTPEQFGGGCKTALPEFEKAMAKYAAFKQVGELYPDWGKAQVETMVKECK